MPTFVLIPGAGGNASYWSRVVPLLEDAGHEAIAVDLREDDPALGLADYAAQVGTAIGGRRDTVVVAQSMGAFTAPMLTVPVGMVILLNPMIPAPGETPGQWWDAVGWTAERVAAATAGGWSTDVDPETYFLHDVPRDVLAGLPPEREPSDTPFGPPCTFETWPDGPLHVLVGADDRFFPLALQRRVARDRLDRDVDVMPGGHLVALSRPAELAARLVAYPTG